ASTWLLRNNVDFGNAIGSRDNPNFRVRFVAEFENSATGAGTEGYTAVKTGSSYSTAGTLWLDMVTVSGVRAGNSIPTNNPPATNINSAPTLSFIRDQQAAPGQPAEAIAFTIADAETAPEQLNLSITCSNADLIEAAGLSVSGTGRERVLLITPKPNAQGSATITMTVNDGELSGSATFQFSVIPTRVFAQWNFNSVAADADPSTGILEAAVGSGNANYMGAVSHSFGTVSGGATSDPAPSDNTMLKLSSFAKQSAENKERGIEFRASTRGRRAIILMWDQYNSGSASSWWRVQYTTNGVDFIDHSAIQNSTPSKWIHQQTVNLSDVSGVDQNANFGLRLVAEFESTAAGAGVEGYTAVDATSNYSTAGTLWIDMVTLLGDAAEIIESDPTISTISNQVVRASSRGYAIPFSIWDAETAPANLKLSVVSPSAGLLTAVDFFGSGTNRTLIVTPDSSKTGAALVTIRVTDEAGRFVETSFFVEVVRNVPPAISIIPDQEAPWNNFIGPLSFAIDDSETAPNQLQVTVSSSNEELVSSEAIVLSGEGRERTLLITPEPDQVGSSTITLSVSDGEDSAGQAFHLTVFAPVVRTNSWPVLSTLTDQVLSSDATNLFVSFSISDEETPPDDLGLTFRFQPMGVVTNYALEGTGTNRVLALIGNHAQEAETVVTIEVTDSEGGRAAASFKVTVLAKIIEEPVAPPVIAASLNNGELVLVWPAASRGSVLESSPSAQQNFWEAASETAVQEVDRWIVRIPLRPGERYFRLRQDP
ncbi:MAG TPA: hypothetical protein VK633_05990, partial [Verrucomicrobiae bacterium]|nr:hypothetical protein [Verrucomicrobiae bacterium]